MHRIEDADAIDEGGKRRFIDQDLPTTIGTVDRAEFSNAVQEEIANTIELQGGTLAATAAADRAAEWRQLHDTIFLDENITTAAVDSISVSKLSDGEIDIDSGESPTPVNYWNQDISELAYRYQASATDSYETKLSNQRLYMDRVWDETGAPLDKLELSVANGLWLDEWDDATGSTELARTDYLARGIKYTKRFGTSTVFANAIYRKEVYSVTGVSWSGSGSNYNGLLAVPVDTNIPWGTGVTITAMWATLTVAGNPFITPLATAAQQSGATTTINQFYINAPAAPTSTAFDIIIEYNADELSD